jgi:VWFA-related protein
VISTSIDFVTRTSVLPRFAFLIGLAALSISSVPHSQAQQKAKLSKPRQLDKGITWHRDPVTGELKFAPAAANGAEEGKLAEPRAGVIGRATVRLVPVTCSVLNSDGSGINELNHGDFRVYDDGVERPVPFFYAPSHEPARVAMVIDASPSVLPDSVQMKGAESALVDALAPNDEVAVVDFAAHTFLQVGFSSDRELLHRAISRVDVRELLGDTGGSNIYEAVYLTAGQLFPAPRGPQAIVLLTDGEDSGLGLTMDPASAAPQPGQRGVSGDKLTFEDVVRTLAAANIQVFAISTENRPKIMTPAWLAKHRDATLVTPDARKSGIPPYTLYLAELVRRTGGQLYFLREAQSLSDTLRQIAQRVGAEYLLGFTPLPGGDSDAPHAGWHSLRVEVAGRSDVTVVHQAAYYVPATR